MTVARNKEKGMRRGVIDLNFDPPGGARLPAAAGARGNSARVGTGMAGGMIPRPPASQRGSQRGQGAGSMNMPRKSSRA